MQETGADGDMKHMVLNAIADQNLVQNLLWDLLSLFDAIDFATCFAVLK